MLKSDLRGFLEIQGKQLHLLAVLGGRRAAHWLRHNVSILLMLIPLLLYLPGIVWWTLPNQFAVVRSGSMEPAFSVGDLVFLKSARDIQVGDVVAFETPKGINGFQSRLLHRVVEFDQAGGRLTTKGDANPDSDPFQVGLESVLGQAASFKVPYAGYGILFLQTSFGKIWIAIIAMVFFLPTLARMGNWARRSARQAVTEVVGLETEKLDRVEARVNETQEALHEFSKAIAEYATHLQSHTEAVKGLSEASQSLLRAAETQNEVLEELKETLQSTRPQRRTGGLHRCLTTLLQP